ncbi:MAG: hypothetical protein E7I52_23740, partial [Klebsiella michiganensis]|nr:hypothetical protein [Klebsiella michiganensis]
SPGCGVNALPGLRVTSNLWPCSPAKRSASREEAAAMPRHGIFPGLPTICGPVARLRAARAGGLSAILPKLAHQRLGLLLVA